MRVKKRLMLFDLQRQRKTNYFRSLDLWINQVYVKFSLCSIIAYQKFLIVDPLYMMAN